MSNEWIEWGGGERPVAQGTLVDVKWRDGREHLGEVVGGKFSRAAIWEHREGPHDIVAYRLHQAPRPASDKQVGGTYYKEPGMQPWDVVDTWPMEQRIGFYRGNALKYLMRMGSKDEPAQEIAKGIHYMEKLLEVLKADAL